jgi:hypothetical protein
MIRISANLEFVNTIFRFVRNQVLPFSLSLRREVQFPPHIVGKRKPGYARHAGERSVLVIRDVYYQSFSSHIHT